SNIVVRTIKAQARIADWLAGCGEANDFLRIEKEVSDETGNDVFREAWRNRLLDARPPASVERDELSGRARHESGSRDDSRRSGPPRDADQRLGPRLLDGHRSQATSRRRDPTRLLRAMGSGAQNHRAGREYSDLRHARLRPGRWIAVGAGLCHPHRY